MYSDSHIHSHFSGDSDTNPVEILEKAIKLNMLQICITDHHDFGFPETDLNFKLNLKEYYCALKELQSRYEKEIKLLIGCEIGLVPEAEKETAAFINGAPFDFIIGSSHLVNNQDPFYPQFFEGRSDKECFTEYFLSIIENLKIHTNFDVYGHLDYIVRYSPNKNLYYSYGEFSDYIDEILRTLIDMGKGIEINTGGYRYDLGVPNPSLEVIKRYRELGGELITMGSDAHTPQHIGYCFQKAAEVMKACGFSYYNIFKDRKPVFLRIE